MWSFFEICINEVLRHPDIKHLIYSNIYLNNWCVHSSNHSIWVLRSGVDWFEDLIEKCNEYNIPYKYY